MFLKVSILINKHINKNSCSIPNSSPNLNFPHHFLLKPIYIEYNCIFIGLSFSVLYGNTQIIENQLTIYDVKSENLNFNPITYKPIRK